MKAKRLTFEEMKAKFPNEWIYVANPKLDEYGNVLSGIVLYHHADQNVFWKESGNYSGDFNHFTDTYTGVFSNTQRPWLKAYPLL